MHFVGVFSALLLALSGCGSGYEMPYDIENPLSAYTLDSGISTGRAIPFASELCVADGDIIPEAMAGDEGTDVAEGLFDINGKNTLVARNVHKRMNPASITKVMTALIALKYGKPEDVLVASKNVFISESGAQVIPLKEGDRMTLDQALHALIMYSANDVAVMIAEYISGSSEEFCRLMNSEAKKLGATNTNFVNPNGLTDENHYTTAYDLYLIFNEALKYESFKELISTAEYSFSYTDASGNTKELSFSNSNQYISGDSTPPSGVSIIGGKTGTTQAAGSCLILLSQNSAGDPFISVVLNAADRNALYERMNQMLACE